MQDQVDPEEPSKVLSVVVMAGIGEIVTNSSVADNDANGMKLQTRPVDDLRGHG